MPELIIPSYAKVNLTLDVLRKRNDGYHDIETVMIPIDLMDQITLRRSERIEVTCTPGVPGRPEENLAYRAVQLLREVTGCRDGVEIKIQKVIPVAGGLAGGSTNGAAVLRGLNELWGTGLSEEELTSLAIQLGSDVPFFIPSRPALVTGIGERLTPIPVKEPLWLVLTTPDVKKSTANVYAMYDRLKEVTHPDAAAMQRALAAGDLAAIAGALGNVFEQVMLPKHPEIGALKEAMLEAGALGSLMSGAGPTVFGLVEDEMAGRRVLEALSGKVKRLHLVRTVY